MRKTDLPKRWHDAIPGEITADMFTEHVLLAFEDGSRARFECAFVFELGNEIGVFTEHCGYHLFESSSVVDVDTEPR